MVAFREGLNTPFFGVAVTLGFIVVLDAASLRKQIGRHAERINQMSVNHSAKALRERVGHSPLEIAAGLLVGALVGWLFSHLS